MCDGLVDAQGFGQGLEEMANRNQRSLRRHSGNRIRVVNLTKLLTDSASIQISHKQGILHI